MNLTTEMTRRIIDDLPTHEPLWTERLAKPGQAVYSATEAHAARRANDLIAAAIIEENPPQVLRLAVGTRAEVESMLFA